MSNFSVITVSQLNRYIKSLLDGQPVLREVYVKGEISGFSRNRQSGHCYFCIKDDTASVRAVLFASHAAGLMFEPDNGMMVIARCSATLYERDGQFQLVVYDMQPDGLGGIFLAFRQLQERLAAEGLFDEIHKKPLPRLPRTIGVVTSADGAAFQDILNVLSRRYPLAKVVLSPAPVQGQKAGAQLANALAHLDARGGCDVIIIGRGGGSPEDLWCFNDEGLARAIFACKTPVISAVGHETDYTICDLVADLRAPTPSAAAELVAPSIMQLQSTVDLLAHRLTKSHSIQLQLYKSRLNTLNYRLYAKSPHNLIKQNGQTLHYLINLLKRRQGDFFYRNFAKVESLRSELSRLNPAAVLGRGYSLTQKDGVIVTSAAQLKPGDMIQITLAQGAIRSTVTEILPAAQSLEGMTHEE